MKNLFYLFFASLLVSFSCTANSESTEDPLKNPKTSISLPLAGNAYSSKHLESNTITDNGIENWTNAEEFFTVYFRISKAGSFQLTVEESVEVFGKSELEFSINNEAKKVTFDTSKKAVTIGTWKINQQGYVAVKIKGINKTKDLFPAINRLTISSADNR